MAKRAAGTDAAGDIGSRISGGESAGQAIASTTGDMTAIVAKGTGDAVWEFLVDMDPLLLASLAYGVYAYINRSIKLTIRNYIYIYIRYAN